MKKFKNFLNESTLSDLDRILREFGISNTNYFLKYLNEHGYNIINIRNNEDLEFDWEEEEKKYPTDKNINPMRYKAEKRYSKWSGKIRIYRKKNISKIVLPGNYTFTETDYGGNRDYDILSFKVTSPMDSKELAIQIAEKTGYISPWGDMRLKKINNYDGPNIFPKHPELF